MKVSNEITVSISLTNDELIDIIRKRFGLDSSYKLGSMSNWPKLDNAGCLYFIKETDMIPPEPNPYSPAEVVKNKIHPRYDGSYTTHNSTKDGLGVGDYRG